MLDDGTGAIATPLQPLFTALTSQTTARSARVWLTTNQEAKQLLIDLAHERLPLKHETFTNHPAPQKVTFLRQLCIEHGVLEPVNVDIERFATWVDTRTADLPADDALLIRQYATWTHLNRMRHLDRTNALKTGTFLAAKQSTTMAIKLLAYLRSRGSSPQTIAQADIDDWLAEGPTTRSLARTFVRWAIDRGHCPAVDFPYRLSKSTPVISQHQRLEHLRNLLNPDSALPAATRTAALFLLLYAQPLTRISRMQRAQVDDTDEHLTVAFTDDPIRIPPPFDSIVHDHISALPHTSTAAHRHSPWLFPGTQPGRHVHQGTIMNQLRGHDIDLRGARNTSLRALVLEMPAPVVADAFNYSYPTASRHHRHAGATFANYIAHRQGTKKQP